jgi:hypothetical protein
MKETRFLTDGSCEDGCPMAARKNLTSTSKPHVEFEYHAVGTYLNQCIMLRNTTAAIGFVVRYQPKSGQTNQI